MGRAAQPVLSSPDFLCLQQPTSLESLRSTPLCSNVINAAVNDFFAHQSRRFWWLFLKGYVSKSLAALSFSSDVQSYPEYLYFSRRYAVPWVPNFLHVPRGPLLANLRTLALPQGPLGSCLLCSLLLPLARSLRWEPRRFALALAGCPLPQAL